MPAKKPKKNTDTATATLPLSGGSAPRGTLRATSDEDASDRRGRKLNRPQDGDRSQALTAESMIERYAREHPGYEPRPVTKSIPLERLYQPSLLKKEE